MEKIAPEMAHEGWGVGQQQEIEFGYVELKQKWLFYVIRIVCARHVECKMRISSLEGTGRYDSWVQLDLG